MNNNLPAVQWYAVCTRPKCEKKVAAALSRKFETYLPLKTVSAQWSFLRKTEQESLFSSIVFVRATEADLDEVRRVKGVVNFLYWLNRPAVINDGDIQGIRSFLSSHQQVRIAHVPMHGSKENFASDLTVAHVQNTERVLLASLGYMLVGELPQEAVATRETPRIHSLRYTDAG